MERIVAVSASPADLLVHDPVSGEDVVVALPTTLLRCPSARMA